MDISDDYGHPWLAFISSDLARDSKSPVCVNPNGDLSTKRNLGLLLARLLGWSRIFFMDDDVRGVSLADLRATVSMLDRYRSVGMRVTDYADNSVVCHAHRATGAKQDVFVSGSVLAVNCQQPFGFFPEIYNEDWLFFYDDVRTRRLGWSGRDVTQLRYDPFENVERAERQEFGDVLAEGLYALLHIDSDLSTVPDRYWNEFLTTRKRFLEEIIWRADSVAPEIGQNIVRAVQTAMLSPHATPAETFEDYIRAWRDDLDIWTERLKTVPRVGSIDEALEALALGPAQQGHADRSRCRSVRCLTSTKYWMLLPSPCTVWSRISATAARPRCSLADGTGSTGWIPARATVEARSAERRAGTGVDAGSGLSRRAGKSRGTVQASSAVPGMPA